MIFLDTNFLVSYYIESEEQHERAVEIANDIEDEEQIISPVVLG
ncbi:MAG: PIN domain-containing protein [Methanobrevibacter sp.]|nr:PIN domain-containing protein [Methanobrevibacter sp.]